MVSTFKENPLYTNFKIEGKLIIYDETKNANSGIKGRQSYFNQHTT